MANREALRELQSRLASRLQAVKSEGLSRSWLAVRTHDANYLFPLTQSGEIFPLAGLQAVPYVQPWFLGVVNLRGGLFGVVDLASFIAGTPVLRSEQTLSAASVVTLNASLEVNCALLVESLGGLRNSESFVSVSAPPEASPPFFGDRYCDASGVFWQEINLQALSQLPRFLAIGS